MLTSYGVKLGNTLENRMYNGTRIKSFSTLAYLEEQRLMKEKQFASDIEFAERTKIRFSKDSKGNITVRKI